MIPHDLEKTPLQIKTDSAAGSKERVIVDLYTAGGDRAGQFQLYFLSTPQYNLHWCSSSWTHLHSRPPSEVNKVWVITKLPGPRIKLLCNGVKVLDITISDDTCSNSDWSTYWRRQVKQIRFHPQDSASDEYWGKLPGN